MEQPRRSPQGTRDRAQQPAVAGATHMVGILAAIAIPVYLNQRTRPVDASIKADLKAADIALTTWLTDNPQSATFNIAQVNATFQASPGNTIQLVGGPNPGPGYYAYCLRGTNPASSGGSGTYYFFHSHQGGLQPGPMKATDTCSSWGGTPAVLQ